MKKTLVGIALLAACGAAQADDKGGDHPEPAKDGDGGGVDLELVRPPGLGGRGTVDQPGGETEPAGGPGQDEGEGDGDEERHDRIQTLLGVP